MSEQAEGEQQAEQPEHRRHPSTVGGAVFLVVLVVALAGIGIVTADRWRLGIQCVAGALGAAALVRLVLPRRDAGMLAVRSRWLDVTLLAVLAGLLWFLAGSIPDQPTM